MSVIGWPNNVNQMISDQTSFTIGESGFVEDSTTTGHKERALTSLVAQRKFNVVMFFDYAKKDRYGLSEYDRFERWYLFRHKRGSVPFEFPSINRFHINVHGSEKAYEMCRYKITSPLQVSKSGLAMQISMTWEEVYSGLIGFSTSDSAIVLGITAENGRVEFIYNSEPKETPLINSYTFTKDGEVYTPKSVFISGGKVIYLFDKSASGTYIVTATNGSQTWNSSFSV